MIGDKIDLSVVEWEMIEQLVGVLLPTIEERGGKYVISIAGESGSGKSVLAHALAQKLKERGIPTAIIQQDDYFRYPPITNDRLRRQNFNHVGTQEVNLTLLDDHLKRFKEGAAVIEKPLVIYQEDKIVTEKLDSGGTQVLIVEGTYVSLLNQVDTRIFIDRDYHQTYADRMRRFRDARDAFIEKVLEKEHRIIAAHKKLADIIITPEFQIHKPGASTANQ